MPAKNLNFDTIVTTIRNRNLTPVYVIHSEEGYFVDAVLKEFENILPDDEKEFNYTVLYAPRIDLSTVPEICHRIPMFSDFQVVILKECQAVRTDDMNILVKYIENPSPSTVLVLAGRGALLKGSLMTAAKKSSQVSILDAKKIYDSELPRYIASFINARGLNVNQKALAMLSEYIGSDLSRLYNEIGKLTEILGPGAMVTPEAIERHIGRSKSYNAFEIVEALARKDALKTFKIADYYRANPKDVSVYQVISLIFNYFSELMITYFLKDKSDISIKRALNIKNNFQYAKFVSGRQNYNAFQVIEIIRAIRAFDRQSKGIGSRRDEHDLFKELMYRILTAPGVLFPQF